MIVAGDSKVNLSVSHFQVDIICSGNIDQHWRCALFPAQFLHRVWEDQPTGRKYLAWWDHSGDKKVFKHGLYKYGQKESDRPELPTLDDLYFCPNTFTDKRSKDDALPSRWLYADLDEVNPEDLSLVPTMAWETSPGRYQALWQLRKHLEPRVHEKVNKKLTYFCEADRGGWGLSKVLRVPGTTSLKRDEPYVVELLWDNGPVYTAKSVWDEVKDTPTSGDVVGSLPELELIEGMTADAVLRKHRDKLNGAALRLINTHTVDANTDRSKQLWRLEKLLLEAGLPPEEVLLLVRETVWNKYRGQNRELRMLWTEIHKIKQQTNPRTNRDAETFEPVRALQFVRADLPPPSWLVEGIWSDTAHGFIAGAAKTYKSLVALDLSVSVASGTKFLGHFSVPVQGPVLYIQEENLASMMQDRVNKIMHSKGVKEHAEMNGSILHYNPGQDLPLYFVNNKSFHVTDEEQFEQLVGWVKANRPKLLVLDPFYLIAPTVDENSSREVAPVMNNLLRLKQDYDCGILIVHHYKKADPKNPVSGGERMSGTGVFHRWLESSLYLERVQGKPFTVKITPEHRNFPPQGVMHVEFEMGEIGDLEYRVHVEHKKEEVTELFTQFRELVADGGGKLLLTEASTVLGVSKDRVKRMTAKAGYKLMKQTGTGGRGRPGLVIVAR